MTGHDPTLEPRPGTFGAALAAVIDLAGRMVVFGWGSLLAGSMQIMHTELAELLSTLPALTRDAAVGTAAGSAAALAALPGGQPIHDCLPQLVGALTVALDGLTCGRVPLPTPEPVIAVLRSAVDRAGIQEQMWLHI